MTIFIFTHLNEHLYLHSVTCPISSHCMLILLQNLKFVKIGLKIILKIIQFLLKVKYFQYELQVC